MNSEQEANLHQKLNEIQKTVNRLTTLVALLMGALIGAAFKEGWVTFFGN